jgi:chromosome segregation ATPase
LACRIETIRTLEVVRLAYERELCELRPVGQRVSELQNELYSTMEAEVENREKSQSACRRADDLEVLVRAAEQEIGQLSDSLATLTTERNELSYQLDTLQQSAASATAGLKRAETREAEHTALVQELSSTREKERDHFREIERLKALVQGSEDTA